MLGVRTRDFRVLLVLSGTDHAAAQAHLSLCFQGARQTGVCSAGRGGAREDSEAGTGPVLTNRRSGECALARNENAP